MNPPRWYLSFVISVCEAADLEWTHTQTVLLCAPRVNERQKMRHYRARSAEERRRRKNAKSRFFYFARCVHKLALYNDDIHSFDCKSAVQHSGGV